MKEIDTNYVNKIKERVRSNVLYFLKEDEVLDMFCSDRAINFQSKKLELDFFKIAQYPYWMKKISQEMLGYIKGNQLDKKFNVCFGDHGNGMWFAYDLARDLYSHSNGGFRAVYSDFDEKTGLPKRGLSSLSNEEDNEWHFRDKVLITYPTTQKPEALETMIKSVPSTEFFSRKKLIAGILVFANILPESENIKKIREKYNFHSIVDIDLS
jgi:hypothetical protein